MNLQLIFLKIGILAVPIGVYLIFQFTLGRLLHSLLMSFDLAGNFPLVFFITMGIPWIVQILSVYLSIRLWLRLFQKNVRL